MTDGESALFDAAKNVFQGMHHGRCTNHFHQNCKDFLKKIGIGEDSQTPLLDIVFGSEGLIESEDIGDLEEELSTVKDLLCQMETVLLSSDVNSSKFFQYISRHKSVVQCLIRSTRRVITNNKNKAEVPKRLYTNQSESLNNILKSRKNALGYSKKDDVSLPLFVKDVRLKVADEKMKEIEKPFTVQAKTIG